MNKIFVPNEGLSCIVILQNPSLDHANSKKPKTTPITCLSAEISGIYCFQVDFP